MGGWVMYGFRCVPLSVVQTSESRLSSLRGLTTDFSFGRVHHLGEDCRLGRPSSGGGIWGGWGGLKADEKRELKVYCGVAACIIHGFRGLNAPRKRGETIRRSFVYLLKHSRGCESRRAFLRMKN